MASSSTALQCTEHEHVFVRATAVQRAEHLASGFFPAHSPTLCPTCLSHFVYCTSTGRKSRCMQANIGVLLYKCHDFWNTLAAFAMREWTPGARRVLDRRLRENRVNCPSCTVTGDHLGMCGCDYFRLLLDSCSTALHMGLNHAPSRREKAYWGSAERWPRTLEQLMPFGAPRAAESLIEALRITRFGHNLFASVLRRERELLMPILSEEATRQRFIAAVFAKLGDTTNRLAKNEPLCDDAEHPRRRLTSDHDISHLIGVVLPSIDRTTLAQSLFRGYNLELFNAICKMLSLADQDGPQVSFSRMLYLASWLWPHLPEENKGEKPAVLRKVDMTTLTLLTDPYRNLHNCLARFTLKRFCYVSGCHRGYERPWDLRKCARCRVVQYCSRECQKADWAHAEHPHRAICDMLHELFVFATLEMTGEEFSAACTHNEFPLERVDRLIAWTGGDVHDYASGAPSVADLTLDNACERGCLQADFTVYHLDKH